MLYVDDEEINLELLKVTFMNDFEVVTAHSAKMGLEILEAHPEIDVIISDLKMPHMNGLDFIKIIKTRDPQKVCLLLTGFMESEVMLEGFNKELIFRYMMKPWNKDDLKTTLLTALERVPRD